MAASLSNLLGRFSRFQ